MLFESSKEKQFFVLLSNACQNVAESARVYVQMAEQMDQVGEYAVKLKSLEKTGDKFTHDIIALLNKLFSTPLDREDILTLAVKIDDVVDGLEAAAARMRLYKIQSTNRFLQGFAHLILSQAQEMVNALEKLQTKNLAGIRENTMQINVLENQGDDLLREALEDLFEHATDPVMIIKLKEIYETLETVTDRAEDVANVLEGVVMKNS